MLLDCGDVKSWKDGKMHPGERIARYDTRVNPARTTAGDESMTVRGAYDFKAGRRADG